MVLAIHIIIRYLKNIKYNLKIKIKNTVKRGGCPEWRVYMKGQASINMITWSTFSKLFHGLLTWDHCFMILKALALLLLLPVYEL
jgi:hypothetical protein